MFVIWLANVASDRSLARWQSDETSATSQQPSELDVLPEVPYGPFVRHLVSVSREYPASDASGLREYVETIRRLLDETPQKGISEPPAPIEGRSRLLPARSGSSSYS